MVYRLRRSYIIQMCNVSGTTHWTRGFTYTNKEKKDTRTRFTLRAQFFLSILPKLR